MGVLICPRRSNPGRHSTGGGDVVGRAATDAPSPGDEELKNWTREVSGFSFMIKLSILPDLSVEFITYLISFTS